jgi:hypothetical protein
MPDSGSAARPSGGEHGQPARQRQTGSEPTEGSDEPVGLAAGFGRRWGGRLGGCPAGDGEALSGQLPLEGGVRGGLLGRGGLAVAPRLPDLTFGGRLPDRFVVGLGLGDGGHAGQVHGRHHGPQHQDPCEFGHGCLLSWSTSAGGRLLTTMESSGWCPRRSPWHRDPPARADVPLGTLGAKRPGGPEVKTLGRRGRGTLTFRPLGSWTTRSACDVGMKRD